METENITKCFMGIKAESLAVALALPKYQLDQLALIPSGNKSTSNHVPLSRKYLTYADKVYWNKFLKLFSPKEISEIDPYLEPLTLYIRSNGKVVSIGQNNWFKNIDIFFKKNFINFKPRTWECFKNLDMKNVNQVFQLWCEDIVEKGFYLETNFDQLFKIWLEQKTPETIFFKSFIEDLLVFFQSDQGLKLWRLVPALYSMKIDLFPNELSVADFIINLIQPHYYFNEKKFSDDVITYLKKNNASFNPDSKMTVVEEENKILYLNVEKSKPIRSDKFWEFPHPNIAAVEHGLFHWSWKATMTHEEQHQISKKIILDVNEFIIDQHFFCGMVALIDQEYEIMFLQKTQSLNDKQLESKLKCYFKDYLLQDDFWATWHDFPKDLSSKPFLGPYLDSTFIYSHQDNRKDFLTWKKSTESKNLVNYKDFAILAINKSYWPEYLFNITRFIWLELYNSKF